MDSAGSNDASADAGVDVTTDSSANAEAEGDAVADATAPVVASLTILPVNAVTIPTAPPTQFTALANYSDGSMQDVTTQATWSSSDSSIVAIGAMTGIATPRLSGTALISASFAGHTADTMFVVATAELTSVDVTPHDPTVEGQCNPEQMTATADWSDGTTTDVTSDGAWTSSSTTTATVDVNGRVTCVSQGTTEVSALVAGVTGTTSVTCSFPVIGEVAVAPPTASIAIGATAQFSASATSSSGTTCDVTKRATWQSATPAVATVTASGNDAGLATGIDAGSSAISASFAGQTGSATLTVQ